MVHAQLEGSFLATVRGVIPDYVLDDSTPLIAILTTFQSGPFLALVGEEAAQLEVGESYIFQIAATEIGEISAAERKTVFRQTRPLAFMIYRSNPASQQAMMISVVPSPHC